MLNLNFELTPEAYVYPKTNCYIINPSYNNTIRSVVCRIHVLTILGMWTLLALQTNTHYIPIRFNVYSRYVHVRTQLDNIEQILKPLTYRV